MQGRLRKNTQGLALANYTHGSDGKPTNSNDLLNQYWVQSVKLGSEYCEGPGVHSSLTSGLARKNIADSTIVELQKGNIVYFQSDPAIHWFEVLNGTVRTCRFYIDGHRQLTGFYFENDVFGLEPSRYAATAEAVTDVVLRKSCSNVHKQVFDRAPPSVEKAEVLTRALERAQHNLFLLGHRLATERVAAFLLTVSGRSRIHDRFELPMSRTDIADHLGLTIHTVSRCFSELVRQHVICLTGRQSVSIVDPVMLHYLAGELSTERSKPFSLRSVPERGVKLRWHQPSKGEREAEQNRGSAQ